MIWFAPKATIESSRARSMYCPAPVRSRCAMARRGVHISRRYTWQRRRRLLNVFSGARFVDLLLGILQHAHDLVERWRRRNEHLTHSIVVRRQFSQPLRRRRQPECSPSGQIVTRPRAGEEAAFPIDDTAAQIIHREERRARGMLRQS